MFRRRCLHPPIFVRTGPGERGQHIDLVFAILVLFALLFRLGPWPALLGYLRQYRRRNLFLCGHRLYLLHMHLGDRVCAPWFLPFTGCCWGNGYRYGLKFSVLRRVSGSAFFAMINTTPYWISYGSWICPAFRRGGHATFFVGNMLRRSRTPRKKRKRLTVRNPGSFPSMSHGFETPQRIIGAAELVSDAVPRGSTVLRKHYPTSHGICSRDQRCARLS